MRYQIRLINTITNESRLTMFMFSSRKKAEEWAEKWRAQGEPFDCEIIDTKRK